MNKSLSAAALVSSLSLVCFLGPMAPLPLRAQYQDAAASLSPEAITQLVSPIALYPDALTALILPAATTPSDVVLAERFLAGGGDPAQAFNQPWDESVKGLLHYPDVLSWMDQSLEWTTSLGEAFATQPADVMNAIQSLRAQARAEGNLIDTPQQQIVVENDIIRILPADPQIIYVPQYDPVVVYTQQYSPDTGSFVSFGNGCAVGSWLSYDFDWGNRCFYHGNWNGSHGGNWHGGGNTTVNVITISNAGAMAWRPNANALHQISEHHRNSGGNAPVAGSMGQTTKANQQTTFNKTISLPHPVRQQNIGGNTGVQRPSAGTLTAPPQQLQRPINGTPLNQPSYPQQTTPVAPASHTLTLTPHSPPPQVQQHQQAQQIQAPERQAAPVQEERPRERPPQPVQVQKVEPPAHQAAVNPAPAANETQEKKKPLGKDTPQP